MEAPYIAQHGTIGDQRIAALTEANQRRMPGKPKRRTALNEVLKARANVGNLLHGHRTIEQSLKEAIIRKRWD